MPVHEWWSGDPRERFWIEITDRDDLGQDLHAPQTDATGREYWSYSLVRFVEPGDVVFHWSKTLEGGPGIVGFSRAVGDVQIETIRWLAHGTRGRQRGVATTSVSWLQPLEDFQALSAPVTQAVLRAHEASVRGIRDQLEAVHGPPIYFPFALSDKRPLRAAQGYLTKLPAAVVSTIPELNRVFEGVDLSDRENSPGSRDQTRSGAGWMQDPVARRQIERHAVTWAMTHLEGLGFKVEDVGGWQSYDIRAVRDHEEVHIEVKGTTGAAVTIELTANEAHLGDGFPRALVVVDQIVCARDGVQVTTAGGVPRVWWDWEPEPDALVTTRYRYKLSENCDRLDSTSH
jgi:hypothetical protein